MAWIDRSLGRRNSVLVLGLLLVISSGLSWLSYIEVRRATRSAAVERIQAITRQLAPVTLGGVLDAEGRLARLADEPAIEAALAPGAGSRERAAARAQLQAALPIDLRTTLILLDAQGRVVAEGFQPRDTTRPGPPPVFGTPGERVTPYRRVNDTLLFYDVRQPVPRGEAPLGFVVQRTRSILTPSSSATIGALLGAATTYLVGSPSSGFWTDLGRIVPPPPDSALRASTPVAFNWEDTDYLGMATAVPGTPFVFIIRSPLATVMLPARAYLRQAFLFAALALVVGGVGAFALGFWLSRPITEIAHTAERISAGDSASRADEGSPGEVGQLARSFNLMVDQVRASEERYRLLAENARDIVSLRDGSGRLVYASPSLEQVLGYPAAEADAAGLARVHPEDREIARRASEEVARSEGTGVASATYRLQRADGEWIWLETLFKRVPAPSGEAAGVLAASRDITRRKRLEELFTQSQKLEAVGRLAGGIAHDFNNLLTVMLGEAEAAQDAAAAGRPAVEHLTQIRSAVERSAALIRQLLTFSRRQVARPELLDPNAVVQSLEGLLRRALGEQIELTIRTGPELPPVRMDEGQLGQVVLNLAVNARDAMPGGGRLGIETRRAQLDPDYAESHPGVIPGSYVLISLSDTGTGMSEEVAAHLFEPYFTTKAPGQGTGLGLATCFGIVTAAGGHIWYYTEPGAGTTFKVYLPPAEGDVRAGIPAASPAATGGSERILLVEDDPTVRNVTARLLRSLGYQVEEADRGARALRLVSEADAPPGLVVSDMVMPEMGGLELAARLRTLRPGLPVLFLSGYSEDAVAGMGSLESEVHFLQKPFTRDELAHAVRKAIRAS